jgi:hypothetical protein
MFLESSLFCGLCAYSIGQDKILIINNLLFKILISGGLVRVRPV